MNISNDRITKYIPSSYHKPHYLWECKSCLYQSDCNSNFVNHKASKKCSMYNGNWFLKMKKKGYKNYYHIVHSFYWDKVMDGIRDVEKKYKNVSNEISSKK
jgi:hypothetical protein